MYNNIVMFMLKSVNINSYKELNRFYRRLRLYKMLYYKDSFCLNKISNISDYDKLELNCVIEAFNIKDRKSRISYVYDSACNYIDKKYVNENICEFKNDRCLYQRYSNNKFNNGCCHDCKYLVGDDNKYCGAKCLGCKVYFCPFIRRRKIVGHMNDIKVIKYYYSLFQKIIIKLDIFKERDVILDDLYNSSLIRILKIKIPKDV